MKKKFLLFDVDHTLLDFSTSEKKALKKSFDAFGIPFTEEILAWYLAHNQTLWASYENGCIPRETIFENRFGDTFSQFSISADGNLMEKTYRQALSEGADLIENALEVISKLSETYKLYIVTNGLASTQEKRLIDSGLATYFEAVFVSEIMGFQKPMVAYFDYCFARIPDFQKSHALIIGDSLSSDIQGGIRAGIDTCWFNPAHLINNTSFQPTYEIHNLMELFSLLGIS
ncbi:putative HAD-hydrolase YfnB [Anaerotignum neopropionicum]|uniref:Putative HAD-hydrolase YfnB n=1 Tax=Anaerotignum neopropionicum TaxID=36847 RepID=A0A136WB53_9FIRM|nr:YjjG family noncanonical pyrimidine nucleotidase [Anaerotignum neopropionicum]KXL51743.1 putative HAD-hydrolase YfnB [Anaerotignum neopropionicum]